MEEAFRQKTPEKIDWSKIETVDAIRERLQQLLVDRLSHSTFTSKESLIVSLDDFFNSNSVAYTHPIAVFVLPFEDTHRVQIETRSPDNQSPIKAEAFI